MTEELSEEVRRGSFSEKAIEFQFIGLQHYQNTRSMMSDGMVIEAVEARVVEVGLAKAYKLAYGTLTSKRFVVVQVVVRGGLIGLGEADPYPPLSDESYETAMLMIEKFFAPLLIGQSALDRTRLMKEIDARVPGHLMTKSAIDVALWDLLGKHLKVPVYQLLGGALNSWFPLLWPIGSTTIEETLETVRTKFKQGFRTFMLKVAADETGDIDIDMHIARVEAIRKEFSADQVHLNVDANQCLSLHQAKRLCAGLANLNVDFIEQPMHRSADNWAMQRLAAFSQVPLSADESLRSLEDAAQLASAHVYDVFSLKVAKNGGISRAQDIAVLARAHGKKILLNSMVELGISQAAGLHLAASLPNLVPGGHCFMSTLRMADDITNFDTWIDREQAIIRVPDAPGLGIQLLPEKLAQLTVSSTRVAAP